MIKPSIWKLLACPACGGELAQRSNGAACGRCGAEYTGNEHQLDVRLHSPRTSAMDFDLYTPLLPADGFDFGPLRANSNPQIAEYAQIPIPRLLRSGNRLNSELLSYFPRSSAGGSMLDLGCGDKDFQDVCRHTNLDYVGLDYSGARPDLLGDAHALPFKDESFDFVVSFAVLEHLRYPFVAMREAFRVLKPGCVFIGSVAFLEPFHMDSYAHLTHLGTYNVLNHAGFDVQVVAPNQEWSALHALGNMILFPRLPKALCDLLVAPMYWLHRLWWKLGHVVDPKPRTSEAYRLPATTGGFRFVARKPS
jgi:SAM-dependent methyltransferase